MYCFEQITAVISYTSCVVSLISATVSSVIALQLWKRQEKSLSDFMFSVYCKSCDREWAVKNQSCWKGCPACSQKDYELDEIEHDDEEENEETVKQYLGRILEPFDISSNDQTYFIDIVCEYIEKKKDDSSFDKDDVKVRVLGLLHWWFIERKEILKKEEHEEEDKSSSSQTEEEKKNE